MPSSSDPFPMWGGSIYPRTQSKLQYTLDLAPSHVMPIWWWYWWWWYSVCRRASFSIYGTCPFWPLHCHAPLSPFHLQAGEALLGWEEGTYVPCLNFKSGSFTFWVLSRPCSCSYLAHLVYISGHHFCLVSCRCFNFMFLVGILYQQGLTG